MSDQFLLFLLLVLPVLVGAVLTYLGILVVGLGPILVMFRSASRPAKGLLLVLAAAVILSPVLFHTAMDTRAQHKADERQAELAALKRTSLAGRLPRYYIDAGFFVPELRTFVEQRYGLRRLPDAEDDRLSQAYQHYRKDERCHRLNPDNPMFPGTRIPICQRAADSVQSALGLREPVLVFAPATQPR